MNGLLQLYNKKLELLNSTVTGLNYSEKYYVAQYYYQFSITAEHTCNVNGTFTLPTENLCPDTVQIDTAQ